MKLVDADAIKAKYPNRKSLNNVLDQAEKVYVHYLIDDVKKEMCKNYCKIPYKYSAGTWVEIQGTQNCPCNDCPLNCL